MWTVGSSTKTNFSSKLVLCHFPLQVPSRTIPKLQSTIPTQAMVMHLQILDGLVGWDPSLVSHVCALMSYQLSLVSLKGISSVKMAISEIGVSFPDSTFGHESRFGIPFTVCTRIKFWNGIIILPTTTV